MARYIRLGINIDHVATIRNARGGMHPDPLNAAKVAELAGADGITAHLREDRRHINDNDVKKLKSEINLPLNLEIAPTREMISFALNLKPERICLVPENRQEITTEGGLNVKNFEKNNPNLLKQIIKKSFSNNIKVSLFLDPNRQQIKMARDLGIKIIELHTGTYCSKDKYKTKEEFDKLCSAAEYAHNIGIEVHAGHGIDFDSVVNIAKINHIVELNIGHFIIGESIFMGLEKVIKKMRKKIDSVK